ncbi:hypothetical protein DLAC_10600 [Tieghemostelium lacteum]|uniref:Uncharacterized protein n=1 Tax=Tieghemostelium lacteum TaxID=361077 RepID=A0A151Z4A1_TIELA|nr:hypothetical protein DLAC_10600 [Tieghemostelium lacteum]|eukprot:KYQ88803.1 hypothetical protein DLAC_10600 [Tieghemostelium lacteum]
MTVTANNNGNDKLQKKKIFINENYLNQLDLTWSSVQNEYLTDKNNSELIQNEVLKKEFEDYIELVKKNLFKKFKDSVEIEKVEKKEVQKSTTSQTQLQKIREFEQEPSDPVLIQQLGQLNKELESIVTKVVQLRQDVPSIINAEVSQNLQKLSSGVNQVTSNNNNNNNQIIPQTPISKLQQSYNSKSSMNNSILSTSSTTSQNNIYNKNDEEDIEKLNILINNLKENIQNIEQDAKSTYEKVLTTQNKSKIISDAVNLINS